MALERRTRIRYTIAEAAQFIVEPGSDSEVSDLEDGEDIESQPRLMKKKTTGKMKI